MRALLTALLFILLWSSPAGAAAQLTCASFDSQTQAQAIFDLTGNEALDEDGDGIACETLGDGLPAAPASRPAAIPTPAPAAAASTEPTAQELAYFRSLLDDAEEIGAATSDLGDLFIRAGVDPTLLFDQDWALAVAVALVTIEEVGVRAQTLEPSPRQQEIHLTWLETNRLMTLAVDDIVVGVDFLDPASLERGSARIVWAAVLLDDLTAAAEAFADDPNAPFTRTYPLFPVVGCEAFPDYATAQQYYAANPDDQATVDPDLDGLACEVFFGVG